MSMRVRPARNRGATYESHAEIFGREDRVETLHVEAAASILSAGRETKD